MSNPFIKHGSKTKEQQGTNMSPAASEPVGGNEVASRQRNEIPLAEHKIASGPRCKMREQDPMVQMAETMKDLQQEIHLEGGSAVGGRGNPQYLTLADVNAFLE